MAAGGRPGRGAGRRRRAARGGQRRWASANPSARGTRPTHHLRFFERPKAGWSAPVATIRTATTRRRTTRRS